MKINLKDIERVKETVKEVEKGCRARCLDLDRLQKAAVQAEEKLEILGVPKKNRKGCIVEMEPEKVANSYRGVPEGTFATIQRGSQEDWFLVDVRRESSGNTSYGRGEAEFLILSELARSALPIKYEL